MLNVQYNAPPTVSRFLDSNAFVRAIVGPVGSGKSSGCVMEIPRRSCEQRPGPDGIQRTRWAVIRNTYPELRDTTRKTFEQWIPAQLGKWHEQSFTFKMKFNTVESEVLFRALDRPEDVKKLLSLELTGAYINEARQVPKSILDVLQTRVGRYPSKIQGGPTWFGIWMDTNPWHVGHWGYKLFSEEKPEGFALFEQPGGLEPKAENVENLPANYYQRLVAGKDQEWIDEYIGGKYPTQDRGSVYGHLLTQLKARGGIGAFDHPGDGIFVVFDLGISDSTAMWFFRIGKGVDVVDHYESHGEPMSHYFSILDERAASQRYQYKAFWLPHDGRNRTLATGRSVLNMFEDECNRKRWGLARPTILPELAPEDGIAAARFLLEQDTTRIHSRCSNVSKPGDVDGIEALRSYKYEYDESNKVYKKTPLHDWSSHTADAFRYLACVAKASGWLLPRPVEKPKGPIAVPLHYGFTLDQAWETARSSGGRRI